eukprot:11179927-Lingulodinium_polyedra.AAC.1
MSPPARRAQDRGLTHCMSHCMARLPRAHARANSHATHARANSRRPTTLRYPQDPHHPQEARP